MPIMPWGKPYYDMGSKHVFVVRQMSEMRLTEGVELSAVVPSYWIERKKMLLL